MKFILPTLRLGQIVTAEVVECISAEEFIVNFAGDLVRVKNTSGENTLVGQKLALRVTSISPLGFQLQSPSRRKQIVNWHA